MAPPSWSATPSHCSVASVGSPHPVQLNFRQSKRLNMPHTSSKVRDSRPFAFGEEERTHIQPRNEGFSQAPSFLAPYLDRACLRSATPCESSTPRMIW